jgi:5-oxoprolinase (ATP-hydrolysing)
MQSRDHSWQLWIDTGGTFTDCVAVAPDGEQRRVKVLSNGALRGVVKQRSGRRRLIVREQWGVQDGFIDGFEFALLGDHRSEAGRHRVAHYERASRTIELDAELSVAVSAGATFEVRSHEETPVLTARIATGTPSGKDLPRMAMRLATTRGTNALLERKGAPTALFVTEGFGDLLEIGTQQRPDLFALDIRKPSQLYETVIEVPERMDCDGDVIRAVDVKSIGKAIDELLAQGIHVAAITFMHSYRNAAHETAVRDLLRRKGFTHVSCSSSVAPFIKIVPRAATTVIDAYLSPLIGDYLSAVGDALPDERLHVMTSAGGLVPAGDFRAKDGLLSGPAGGVVGAASAARLSGHERIISFDMGGTSTDVARVDGDFEYVFSHTVGEANVVGAALAVESVAAGGGSICWFDGYRLRVGSESAGAEPGPACYDRGGPLTVTDVNLLLGRLHSDRFEIPIVRAASEAQFAALEAGLDKGRKRPVAAELLEGFLAIANERMADAIRRVSVRKGYDPRDFVLVAFGGAGAQHACAVARRLGMTTVLVPHDASLLSAHGLGDAALERFAERQILESLNTFESRVTAVLQELASEARDALMREGVEERDVTLRRRILQMRFRDQDMTLDVEFSDGESIRGTFEERYQSVFGYLPQERDVEVESVRVVCSSSVARRHPEKPPARFAEASAAGEASMTVGGRTVRVPFFERDVLDPGARLVGPALVFESHSATVIEPGWNAHVDAARALVLEWGGADG